MRDSLEEVLSIGLILEKKASVTVIQLERVEKQSILVVLEVNIELLVP